MGPCFEIFQIEVSSRAGVVSWASRMKHGCTDFITASALNWIPGLSSSQDGSTFLRAAVGLVTLEPQYNLFCVLTFSQNAGLVCPPQPLCFLSERRFPQTENPYPLCIGSLCGAGACHVSCRSFSNIRKAHYIFRSLSAKHRMLLESSFTSPNKSS